MSDFLSFLGGLVLVGTFAFFLWKTRGQYYLRRLEHDFPRSLRPAARRLALALMVLMLIGLALLFVSGLNR